MADPNEHVAPAQQQAIAMIHNRRRHLQAILDCGPTRTLSVAAFEQIVFDSFRQSPKLAQCRPETVLGAALESAKARLPPNTAAGYCWIVPLNKWDPTTRKKGHQAEWWLGYQGAKVLATRDGRVIHVWGRVVHENDPVFEVVEGSEPRLVHEPLVVHKDRSGRRAVEFERHDDGHPIDPRGPIVAAYACARNAIDRQTHFTALAAAEILPIELAVLARQSRPDESPWRTHRGAMWQKTAVKRLAKRDLQLPDEAARPMQLDSLAEAGKPQQIESAWDSVERGESKIHQVAGGDEPRALDKPEASPEDAQPPPGPADADDVDGAMDVIDDMLDGDDGRSGEPSQ